MECNKEEAVRAMQLSETKMQKKDFKGAKVVALKAQQLFPELENLAQLLTVCEVHCAAENKLGGSVIDWYRILQIQQFDDDATIKKQYRKLGLLLHPDKNAFTGAEAAFKLIGEANRVLANKESRAKYDMQYRAFQGSGATRGHHSNVNLFVRKCYEAATNVQYTSVNLHQQAKPQQQVQPDTIRISCPSCKRMYEYNFANRFIFCESCLGMFDASDSGPESFGNQFSNKTEAPSQVNKHGVGVEKQGGVDSGERSKTGIKANSQVHVQENVRNPSELCGGHQSRRSSENQQNLSSNESPVNDDDDDDDVVIVSPRESLRKSPFSSATVKKRNHSSMDGGGHRRTVLALSAMDEYKKIVIGRGKGKRTVREPLEGCQHRKKSQSDEVELKVEEEAIPNNKVSKSMASMQKKSQADEVELKVKAEAMPDNNVRKSMASMQKIVKAPNPEFKQFVLPKDALQKTVKANQIWVLYDPADGMPRRYACIKKVLTPGFKVKITWLEPIPEGKAAVDWCKKKLPVSCGHFRFGNTEEITNHTVFSHEWISTRGKEKNSFSVYPRKGETWALYQNWDMGWSDEPEKHSPFQFDFVEVVSNYSANAGVRVVYLDKIKGFVSLFDKAPHHGTQVPADALYRFSHQIPSFVMSGSEGYGVPTGSFELDPAALPASLFDRRSLRTVTVAVPSAKKWAQKNSERGEISSSIPNQAPIVID